MQAAARVGCEANDVARVGGDFRVYEDDVKHDGHIFSYVEALNALFGRVA